MQAIEEGSGDEERNARAEVNYLGSEIVKLRGRWELASVLNFLDVFSPILGKDLKLSAEEIEIGLIKPDASLAQLHIRLLKGTPPVSKTVDDSDKWVTALCKKLTMWWPWVAEGNIPLLPSKGEEVSKYKELDPSDRLVLLKALCEVRADVLSPPQHDAVSYINGALKEGTQISSFRKDALGKDGIDTSYWYDANAKGINHRLYREIITSDSNTKLPLPTIKFQWETLATNFEEFSKVAEKFSFSKSAAEVAVSMKLQSDAIPALEKIRKKKERALKQKQRQDMLLKDVRSSFCSGNTRSCRTRRPINYTFEAYDRTMKEAIQLTNKRRSPVADQDRSKGSEDKSNIKDVSTDSDSKREMHSISDSDNTGNETENQGGSEEENDDIDSESGNSEAHSSHPVSYSKGVRYSKRLAGVTSHAILESRGLATKQRLRQRPTRNFAIEPIIVPDSDDEAHEGKTDLS